NHELPNWKSFPIRLEHGDDLAEGPTPNQLKEFEDCCNSLLQELHDRIDNLLHGFAPADQQAVIGILTRAGRFVVADGAMSTLHASSLSGRQVAPMSLRGSNKSSS